jgi:hypothetical protein
MQNEPPKLRRFPAIGLRSHLSFRSSHNLGWIVRILTGSRKMNLSRGRGSLCPTADLDWTPPYGRDLLRRPGRATPMGRSGVA